MNKRTIILAVALFVVIIIGMFTYAYLKSNEQVTEGTEVTTEEVRPDRYASIDRVDATHFYIDGTHTLVGEFVMPTPCDLLASAAAVEGSLVTIDFTVINNAETCIQSLTPARFMVSAEAAPGAQFEAYIQGRLIPVNLIEALPGQTPDSFELFIKG